MEGVNLAFQFWFEESTNTRHKANRFHLAVQFTMYSDRDNHNNNNNNNKLTPIGWKWPM